MVSLRLESSGGSLDLDGIEMNGYGVQALSGATGFGLPPVDVQWQDSASDGARYRSTRVVPRDLDIPLNILGRTEDEMRDYTRQLVRIVTAPPIKLIFVEGRDSEWSTDVARVGGGAWTYGVDTEGRLEATTTITFRAGDPYFSSVGAHTQTVDGGAVRGLLTGPLSKLALSSSQSLGVVTLNNEGDAPSYPVWTIKGPGTSLVVASQLTGEQFTWDGTLNSGETLTIDTKLGTCVDQFGANRYASFGTRPRLWAIPPGSTLATVSMQGTTAGQSQITCSWRPRRWVCI